MYRDVRSTFCMLEILSSSCWILIYKALNIRDFHWKTEFSVKFEMGWFSIEFFSIFFHSSSKSVKSKVLEFLIVYNYYKRGLVQNLIDFEIWSSKHFLIYCTSTLSNFFCFSSFGSIASKCTCKCMQRLMIKIKHV